MLSGRSKTSKEPGSLQDSLHHIERCGNETDNWMTVNNLKINPEKAQALVIAAPKYTSLVKGEYPTLLVASDIIVPVDTVRNLGIRTDSAMTMNPCINNITWNCFYVSSAVYKAFEGATQLMLESCRHWWFLGWTMRNPSWQDCQLALYPKETGTGSEWCGKVIDRDLTSSTCHIRSSWIALAACSPWDHLQGVVLSVRGPVWDLSSCLLEITSAWASKMNESCAPVLRPL